jgi:hypothetical protein
MAKIPVYTAQQDLQPAAMPRVSVDTSAFSAMGQAGNALSALGARYGELQARQEAFGLRSQESAWIEQFAREDDEAARNIPVNGQGYTESRAKAFDERAQEFLGKVPEQARTEYAARIGQQRDRYLRSWAGREADQAGKYSIGELDKFSTTARQSIYNNPDDLDAQIKEARERVALAPGLTTDARVKLTQQMDENFRAIAAQRIAGSNPEEMARLMGVRFGVAPSTMRGPAQDPSVNGWVEQQSKNWAPRAQRAAGILQAESGLSAVAVAGLLGNVVQESGLKTSARNKGDGRDGSDSIGISQWNSSRAAGLKKFAAEQGKDWSDFDTQVRYLVHEMKTTERGTYERLKNAKTVEEAAGIAVGFFRPAGWNSSDPSGSHGFKYRVANAQKIAGLDPTGPQSSMTTVNGGDSSSLKADPRFEALPFETRTLLVQQATAQQQRDLLAQQALQRTEAARREADRKVLVDELQFKASKGEVGMADVDMMWKQNAFKSFEEYNSVVTQVKKAQTDASAYDRGVAMFSTPDFIFNPLDKAHREALSAIDTKSGTIDRLQNSDPRGAVEVSTRFAESGMVSNEAKGMFEGMIRGGNPSQLEYALQALDGMHRRNPNAFAEAFGSDTMKTLAMWQSSLDKNPAAFRDRLKTAMDPANAKARSEAEKVGRDVVSKMDDNQLLAVFDESIWSDPEKALGARSSPGMGVLKEEYASHYADGFATSQGDETAAKTYADRMIKQTWAISPSSQGRVMKYAPETLPDAILPSVNGSRDWMKDQVEGAVRERLGIKGPLNVETFGVQLAGAAQKSVGALAKFSLVATAETRAEIDILKSGGSLPNGRKSPAWMLVYQDASTGVFKEAAFYFDVNGPRAAREKRLLELQGARDQRLQAEGTVTNNAGALERATGGFRDPAWQARRQELMGDP